ncbi:MAG TPA: tetratricopeptide repeat protein [Planctomycetota bacterium]|nr:tetratricopeptide repeat protein [Planctomycetota bacterium]
MRLDRAFSAALAAALLGLSGFAGAGEPTISEMLQEATARSQKAPAETTPTAPGAESEYLRNMKARLEAEANRRFKDRRGDMIGLGDLYFDIQNFDAAMANWNSAVQKLPNDWQVRAGYVHQRLCRLYTMKGQKELAAQMLEESTTRAPNPGVMHHVDRLKTWAKEFPLSEESGKDLKAAVGKAGVSDKDAENRWKLLLLYREAYPMRLDEFVELIKFIDLYPKDQRVAVSGEADWRLMELMMTFGINDEAMRLAEQFRAKFPKSGLTSGGEACWRLGDWSGRLGRPADALTYYRELREKYPKHWAPGNGEAAWRIGECCRELKRWQEAGDAFKEVRDKYKDHWTCNPPPGQQALINERIFEATKNGAR